MKTLLFLLLFASPALSQTYYTTFSAKSFATTTTSTDTSGTIQLFNAPYVSVATITTGSDSSKLYVNVDAMVNGVWNLSVVRDTVPLGRPTGHNVAATKGQVDNYYLRLPASDLINNAYQIRIRNIHASGSGDSTSALTYTQKIGIRQ